MKNHFFFFFENFESKIAVACSIVSRAKIRYKNVVTGARVTPQVIKIESIWMLLLRIFFLSNFSLSSIHTIQLLSLFVPAIIFFFS